MLSFPSQYRGTPIPGIQTAETFAGSVAARGPWTPFGRFQNQLGGNQKFTRPPISSGLLTDAQMMREFGAIVPQMKRARTMEAAAKGTNGERFKPIYSLRGGPSSIGRPVSLNILGDKIMGALGNPLQDVMNPTITNSTRIHQNRLLVVPEGDPARAQSLAGQPVWNFVPRQISVEEAMQNDDFDMLGVDVIADNPEYFGFQNDRGGLGSPDGVYSLNTTAVVNYKLRVMDTMDKGLTAEDVSQLFHLDGVCVSATDEANDKIFHASGGGVINSTINIEKRHEDTLNHWGRVRPHTPLWFIIKRIDGSKYEIPSQYILSSDTDTPVIIDTSGFPAQRQRAAPNAIIHPAHPLQIIPWTPELGQVRPEYNDLVYTGITGKEEIGVGIRLGYARKASEGSQDYRKSWYNSAVDRMLGPLDIIVSKCRTDGY